MLQSIAERGRALVTRDRRGVAEQRSANLAHLCEDLLSRRGEASGVALAREILSRYSELKTGPRIAFFRGAGQRFRARPVPAQRCRHGLDECALRMPRRPSSIARPSRVGLSSSAASISPLAARPRWCACAPSCSKRWTIATILPPSTTTFLHLFSSWFNRGFLVLRTIDWSTPANLLEKIIRYEAVHAIRDWNDLRARIDSPDRRCYAFFHPALVDEP
jgi:malonyl-CoA decarboxylase